MIWKSIDNLQNLFPLGIKQLKTTNESFLCWTHTRLDSIFYSVQNQQFFYSFDIYIPSIIIFFFRVCLICSQAVCKMIRNKLYLWKRIQIIVLINLETFFGSLLAFFCFLLIFPFMKWMNDTIGNIIWDLLSNYESGIYWFSSSLGKWRMTRIEYIQVIDKGRGLIVVNEIKSHARGSIQLRAENF